MILDGPGAAQRSNDVLDVDWLLVIEDRGGVARPWLEHESLMVVDGARRRVGDPAGVSVIGLKEPDGGTPRVIANATLPAAFDPAFALLWLPLLNVKESGRLGA